MLTSLIRPDADAFVLYRAGLFREAESTLLQLKEFKPENWMLLAQIRMAKGSWQGALMALDEIPLPERSHAAYWVLLGSIRKELDQFGGAMEAFNQALSSEPDLVPALTNRAALYLLMGNSALAEADLLKALRLRPDFADAKFHLGGIRLHQGDFEAGWLLYESRWQTALSSALANRYDSGLRWSGLLEELPRKRLLVYGEQGLGDMLQFSRFLPLLFEKNLEIVLQVPMSLHRLFAQQWPNLVLVDSRMPYTGDFDRHCSLISLPHLLRLKTPCALPWINSIRKPKPSKHRHKPRVGLVWSGMSVRDLERYTTTRRSMGLNVLLPVLSEDVCFVSLQVHVRPEDRALMEQLGVEDLSEQLTNFYETALVMQTLDLVISIDTSVVHLAGALGVPAWVMLPKVSDYRWSGSPEASLWYPELKTYRQKSPGDWSVPVSEVAQDLGQKFGLR